MQVLPHVWLTAQCGESLRGHRYTELPAVSPLTVNLQDYLPSVQRITYWLFRVTYCEFRGLLTLLVKGYLSYLLETLTICLEVYLPLVQIVAYYSLKGLLTVI